MKRGNFSAIKQILMSTTSTMLLSGDARWLRWVSCLRWDQNSAETKNHKQLQYCTSNSNSGFQTPCPRGKTCRLRNETAWVQNISMPLTSYAFGDKFLNFVMPYLFPLKVGMVKVPTPMSLFWEFNELTHYLNVSAPINVLVNYY